MFSSNPSSVTFSTSPLTNISFINFTLCSFHVPSLSNFFPKWPSLTSAYLLLSGTDNSIGIKELMLIDSVLRAQLSLSLCYTQTHSQSHNAQLRMIDNCRVIQTMTQEANVSLDNTETIIRTWTDGATCLPGDIISVTSPPPMITCNCSWKWWVISSGRVKISLLEWVSGASQLSMFLVKHHKHKDITYNILEYHK